MANGEELERLVVTLLADDTGLEAAFTRIIRRAREVAAGVSQAFEAGTSGAFASMSERVEQAANRQRAALDPMRSTLEGVRSATERLASTTAASSQAAERGATGYVEMGAAARTFAAAQVDAERGLAGLRDQTESLARSMNEGKISQAEFRAEARRLQSETNKLALSLAGVGRETIDAAEAAKRARFDEKEATEATKAAILALKNETMSLRQTTEAGATETATAIARFKELQAAAMEAASGFSVTSSEYKGFTAAAATASRSIAVLEGRVTKLGFSANNAVGVSHALRQNMHLLGPQVAGAARSFGILGIALGGFARTGPGALGAIQGIGNGLQRLTTFLPMIGALAAGAAVAGLVRLGNVAAETADKIDKGAQSTGLSIEAYQELQYAFDQNGIAADRFDMALQTLNRRLGQAATGNAGMADSFRRLGVSIRDVATGSVRDVESVFTDAVRAISTLPSAAEQAAAAASLFGDRIGAQLLPALAKGVDGIEDLRDAARSMGLIVSGSAVMSLVQYKDSMATLQRQFQTARVEIVAGFIPLMTNVLIPLLQNTIVPAIQRAAASVTRFTEKFFDIEEAGQVFRADLAKSIEPIVRLGAAAVGTGAIVAAAFNGILAAAAGLGAGLGTIIAQIEQHGFLKVFVTELEDLAAARREAVASAAEPYSAAVETAASAAINAFTFDLGSALDGLATTLGPAARRGGTALGEGLGEGIGEGLGSKAPLGSLAALRQQAASAREAYENAVTDVARAAALERERIVLDEIDRITKAFAVADPLADVRTWAGRLGYELEAGLKSAADVFAIIMPRIEELREEALVALADFGFDSQEFQTIYGKIQALAGLLASVTDPLSGAERWAGRLGAELTHGLKDAETVLNLIYPTIVRLRDEASQALADNLGFDSAEYLAIMRDLTALESLLDRLGEPVNVIVTPRVAVDGVSFESLEELVTRRDAAQRAYARATTDAGREAALALVDQIQGAIDEIEARFAKIDLSITPTVTISGSLGALNAQLAAARAAYSAAWSDAGRDAAMALIDEALASIEEIERRYRAIDISIVPTVDVGPISLIDKALAEQNAAIAARNRARNENDLRAANERVRIAQDEVRRLNELGGATPAIRDDLAQKMEDAALAARVFGTENALASVNVGLLEGAIRSLLALDPESNIDDLVKQWRGYTEAAAIAKGEADALARVTSDLAGAQSALAQRLGQTPTEIESLEAAFRAAAEATVISQEALEGYLATLASLPTDQEISIARVRDDLEARFAAAAVAATAFGDASEIASVKTGLLEGAIQAILLLDPSAEVDDLIDRWREWALAAAEATEAAKDHNEMLANLKGAYAQIDDLTGRAPSKWKALERAFIAAAEAGEIAADELERLLRIIRQLERIDTNATAMQRLAGNLDIGTAIMDGLTESIESIRAGELQGALSGLTSLGVAIGNAVGQPAAAALIGAIGSALQSAVGLFRSIRDLFTGDNQARRDLARALTSTVAGAFKTGILEGVRGGDDWQKSLREGVEDAILGALIDAFIQSAVISAILQPFIDEFTKILHKSGVGAAMDFMAAELDSLLDAAIAVADGFVREAAKWRREAERVTDTDPIDPRMFQLPSATVSQIAAPAWATRLDTTAQRMTDASGVLLEAAIIMKEAAERGITVNDRATRGIDAQRAS